MAIEPGSLTANDVNLNSNINQQGHVRHMPLI